MSLVQVSSNSYNKDSSTQENQTDIGNTGSDFVTRFNEVYTVPKNAQVALCQAVFNQNANPTVAFNTQSTEDRKTACVGLLFGICSEDGTAFDLGAFRNGVAYEEELHNHMPTNIPQPFFAPLGDYGTVHEAYDAIAKTLNLTPIPSLQERFEVTSVTTAGGITQQTIEGNFQVFTRNSNTDGNGAVLLRKNLKYITNVPLSDDKTVYPDVGMAVTSDLNFGSVFQQLGQGLGLGNLERVALESELDTSDENIEKFVYRFQPGFDAPDYKSTQFIYPAVAISSHNGFHDADGHIECGRFGGNKVRRANVGPGFELAESFMNKRLGSFGLTQWVSPYAGRDGKWSNAFGNTSSKGEWFTLITDYFDPNPTIPATDRFTLRPYQFGEILMAKLQINDLMASDFFFLIHQPLDKGMEDYDPSTFDSLPNFGLPARVFAQTQTVSGVVLGAGHTISICAVERGGSFLGNQVKDIDTGTVDQEADRIDLDPDSYYRPRLVVLATGDKLANDLFGVPYSGYLDCTNIPEPRDDEETQALRFMNIEYGDLEDFVLENGFFPCFDDIVSPFDDGNCLEGLEIMNSAYRIKFFRPNHNHSSDPGNTFPNLVQITACRKHASWLDLSATPDPRQPVIGRINQATYPLQFKVGLTRQDDECRNVKYVPVATSKNCYDLIKERALSEYNISEYLAANQPLPNKLLNAGWCNWTTPVTNYYPIFSRDGTPFIPENRHPTDNGVDSFTSGAGAFTTTTKAVRGNVMIILGGNVKNPGLNTIDTNPYNPYTGLNPFLSPNIVNKMYFDIKKPFGNYTKADSPLQKPPIDPDDPEPEGAYFVIPATLGSGAVGANPGFTRFSNSYDLTTGYTTPYPRGMYVHLLDLPNFSVMGSVSEVNSKMIGLINDYDRMYTSTEGLPIQGLSLQSSQKFPIYVDLRNPQEYKLSSLHIKITDRYNNLVSNLTNVQLILHIREKPPIQGEPTYLGR
jgi:hypothetical protein